MYKKNKTKSPNKFEEKKKKDAQVPRADNLI